MIIHFEVYGVNDVYMAIEKHKYTVRNTERAFSLLSLSNGSPILPMTELVP